MPSSRRRPHRGGPEEDPQPRRSSSRRRGSERRGISSQERHDLFSEPPEHESGDDLDSIGLHDGGRRPSSRRAVSERGSRRGSQRESSSSGARSKREKQNWARRKVRKLLPLGVLLGIILLGGIAFMIPGWISGSRLDKLESSVPFTREQAAHDLGRSGSALDELQAKVENGKFDGSAGAAALALSRCGEAGIKRLEAAAASKGPEARAAAAFGLGLTGHPSAVPTLAKLLAGDDESSVRIEAARALGQIKSPDSVAALVAQAEAQSEVRGPVLAAVLGAACKEAKDQLAAGLGAPTGEMREACSLALLTLDPGYWPDDAELRKLFESKKAAVRTGAVQFLELKGGGLFDEMIPKALADEAETVRAAAAAAAGACGWKQAAGALEKMLLDEAEKLAVKLAAAAALGKIHRLESAEPLARCLVDAKQHESVRLAAAEALIAVARRHKFKRETGKFDGEASHLAAAIAKPDIRWEALKVLTAGCDSFGAKAGPKAFEAMKRLAGRKLAAKPEIWKAWMTRKQEDAEVLGHISHLVEKAYKLGTKHPKSWPTMKEALDLSKELYKKAEPQDQDYFKGLFEDLCAKTRLDPKEEIKKGPTEKEPEKKEEVKKEAETEKD